jgi:hypothetical protein
MLLRGYLTKSISSKLKVAATSPTNVTAIRNNVRQLSTLSNTNGFPTPILFDYETIKNNLTVADAISSVEEAFGALANGKVDVPMPMHIGIEESDVAGPGDCHIKVRRILHSFYNTSMVDCDERLVFFLHVCALDCHSYTSQSVMIFSNFLVSGLLTPKSFFK